ncbi:MAG: zinc ABC transporter substrate-binding protein [Rhodobacteraceae bacterium]|nr:zinc ABC transporter substrate-binding protein [Paracoccaceae bacterium]
MRRLVFLFALAATPACAEVPRVVTDMPVVQSLVASVMGELGSPGVLLDKGADAHDFQLRPSQRAALGEADIVFWIGPEMTPWLDRALEAASPSGAIALLHTEGTHTRNFAEAEMDHAGAHDDHDGHDDHDDHDDHEDTDHGHVHAGLDPHAWLDPANGAVWLDVIADALAARDPENGETYRANAASEKAGLMTLAGEMGAVFANLPSAPIVVGHDAFGYFADRFGLSVAASVAEGDAAAPGAAHLSEIREILESGGAACIFPEAGSDPKIIATLAEGTPARIGRPLDPSGRSMEPGSGLYTAILRSTAESIHDCLSAAP